MTDRDICAELVSMNTGWLPSEQTERMDSPSAVDTGVGRGGMSRND